MRLEFDCQVSDGRYRIEVDTSAANGKWRVRIGSAYCEPIEGKMKDSYLPPNLLREFCATTLALIDAREKTGRGHFEELR